jgi:hypothetical protein
VYNLIRYIEPALGPRRLGRGAVIGIMSASAVLAWLGVAFAYVVILPAALRFFAGFGDGMIKPLISTTAYFSFVTGCLVSFAAIFQLPLLLLFINHIRRMPPGSLGRYRRHVIIGSFALALVLPFTYDPITQFLVALPIIVLYELSVALVWLVNRRGRAGERRAADAARAADRARTAKAPMTAMAGRPAFGGASQAPRRPARRPQPPLDLRPQVQAVEYRPAAVEPVVRAFPALERPRLVDGRRIVQLG